MSTILTPFLTIQMLAAFLFFIGFLIVILRHNVIVILMGIELMLNAANLSFVAFSKQNAFLDGPLGAIFVIIIAAAESAIGLSILVNFYRNFGSGRTTVATTLKD